MVPEIKYRKLRVEEFPELRDLFGDDPMRLWPKYAQLRIKQLENHEIDIYVFEVNGEIIGELTVHYVNQNLPTETIPGQRAYFSTFRVIHHMQGLGIGQELMNYAIEDLKSKGYTEFTVGVEADNPVANHIYAKMGFIEPIDKGHGDEFDPVDYVLYLKRTSLDAPEAEIVG